jgi:hypothetical protein
VLLAFLRTPPGLAATAVVLLAPAAMAAPGATPVVARGLRLELVAEKDALWRIAPTSGAPGHSFAPPVFPLDG